MCNPASLVVTRENIYWSKTSESHEDILKEFNIRDEVGGKITLVRIECVPPDGRYDSDTKKWPVKVDQDNAPDWWDAKKFDKRIRAALKAWQKCKVIAEKEKREEVKDGEQIVAVYGKVNAISGGTVNAISGGTVNVISGGTVTVYDGRKLSPTNNAVVIDRSKSKVCVYLGDGRKLD
jgi:hypothetical protein